MFRKIKKHAFVLVCSVIFVFYFLFLSLVFFAPRVDLQERGFVFCTKQMMDALTSCGKKEVLCASKVVLKNHVCDFNVVKTGFVAWLKGTQKTPWANYYFEPVIEAESDLKDEELQIYYQKHLDMLSEMEDLNKKHIELEKQIKHIENEKTIMPEINEEKKNDNKD